MSLEVRWLREAIRNLVEEGEYIALDDPDLALEVTRRIRTAVDNLAQFPHLGRPGRVSGTRELVVPSGGDTSVSVVCHATWVSRPRRTYDFQAHYRRRPA